MSRPITNRMTLNDCRSPRRRAFTLVELLVTLAIIALLVALLLPAVQGAREAARNSSCKNNLRNMALAVELFEGAHQHLPSATYGAGFTPDKFAGSPFTKLLPFLEYQELADRYDWQQHWGALVNQSVVQTTIPTYLCPSSQGSAIQEGLMTNVIWYNPTFPDHKAAVGNYAAVFAYNAYSGVSIHDPFGVGALSPIVGGLTGRRILPTRRMVKDGSRNTLTLVERSARTELWIRHQRITDRPPSMSDWMAPWAGWGGIFIATYSGDGTKAARYGFLPCAVNCNNEYGIYAFHKSGANAAFLDGSVRFLSEDLDGPVLFKLISRAGGEQVDIED